MPDPLASAKLDFAATHRNRSAILDVLRSELPDRGVVLEVASGSGQHTASFAPAFPGLVFQPSDLDDAHLASIRAWTADQVNVRRPVRLDVLDDWPIDAFDAVFCANMIHIAPAACTGALVAGVGRRLSAGGAFVLYGPFQRDGRHTSEGNARFDRSLRERNPQWGVRDLGAVVELAGAAGLVLTRVVQMPANNLSVVFRAG